MNDTMNIPRNVRGNMMIIQFRYSLYEETTSRENYKYVSRNEMSEMLKDFADKLETLDCKASFYLAWGYDEGRTDDKEYKNIDKVIDVIYKTDRTPLVTMKITAPSDIIVD